MVSPWPKYIYHYIKFFVTISFPLTYVSPRCLSIYNLAIHQPKTHEHIHSLTTKSIHPSVFRIRKFVDGRQTDSPKRTYRHPASQELKQANMQPLISISTRQANELSEEIQLY